MPAHWLDGGDDLVQLYDGFLRDVGGGGQVQREGAGNDADENEHNQAHAFSGRSLEPCAKLTPVQVSTKQAANEQRRRFLSFGRLEEGRVADDRLHEQEQDARAEKADQR